MPPLYEYKCNSCGKIAEKANPITEHKNGPECCGKVMRQYFGSISIAPDFEPYLDHNICEKPVYVKSKQHRRELMKKHNVSEAYGKGWF